MAGKSNSRSGKKHGKTVSRKALAQKTVATRKAKASATNILEGFFPAQPGNKTMEKIMTQSKSQMDKIAQEATSFGRESFEAFMESSNIFTKGFEQITRTAVALAQTSAEKQAQFLNKAMSSKTLNEWAETQNKIAQASLDDLMSNVTKLSEMSIKVLTEAAEPINEQMGKGMRKATQSRAA